MQIPLAGTDLISNRPYNVAIQTKPSYLR